MYHLKFILSPMNLFRENKRLQRVIDATPLSTCHYVTHLVSRHSKAAVLLMCNDAYSLRLPFNC